MSSYYSYANSIKQSKGDYEDKFRQLDEDLPTANVYRNAAGEPGHQYWQQQVDYRIKAQLDEDKRSLSAQLQITYHNNSPDTLKYLWLQLDQNIYNNDSISRRTQTFSTSKELQESTSGKPVKIGLQTLRKQQFLADTEVGYQIASITYEAKPLHYIGVFWLLLISVDLVFAHQQKMAVTTLLFNQRSGLLEVTHKFYLHDAEHAVKDLFSPSANIVSDKLTQETFIHYVERQFSVKNLKGENIALSSVGSEVDGRYFWVYQEVNMPNGIEGIHISNGALRDLWPSQVNLVNVEGKGALQSLLFEGQSDWLTLVLKSQ